MERFEVLKEVGRGAFAACRIVLRLADAKLLVAKQFTVPMAALSRKEQDEAANEIDILSKLHHANIVYFDEYFIMKDDIMCIVMEFADGTH